jgi:uncharacterized delta-60 repeat protein
MFNKVVQMQVAFNSWAKLSQRRSLARATSAATAVIALVWAGNALATFANGTGIARVPNAISSSNEGFGIALQSDGKIVLAGRCFENGSKPCVARLNADGTMDSLFNPSGAVPGKHIIDGLTLSSNGLPSVKVLIADDGKIVLATTCRATIPIGERSVFCVARLNPSGELDNTFDGPDTANPGNGRFVAPFITSNNSFLNDAALHRNDGILDGRIVLVGQCGIHPCVARLKPSDGSFDADSASNPLVGPPSADRGVGDPGVSGRFVYKHPSPSSSSSGAGAAVAVETTSNGKTVIAGSCGTLYNTLCLAMLNRDGTWDDDFRGESLPIGQGGRIIITATNQSGDPIKQKAVDIKMQADGRFLLQCKYIPGSSASQCMYRLNLGGTIDTNFSSGLPFPSVPGRVVYNPVGDALAFAITPPGGSYANRIVTLGDCDGVGGFSGAPMCITAILNGASATDGVIDTSLIGPNGDQAGTFNFSTRFVSQVAGNDPKEIVANAAGEFFVVGECDNQMCVYKFRPDGALDTSACIADVNGDLAVSAAYDGLEIVRSMLGVPTSVAIPAGMGYDIDGDGVLNASRDGLLLLRRMLGFSDAALLNDITFARFARRSTWPDIESYLRKRCRIPRTQIIVP